MASQQTSSLSLLRALCLCALALTVALSTVPRCLVLGELLGLHQATATLTDSCHETKADAKTGSRISNSKLCRCDLLDLSTSCLPIKTEVLALAFITGLPFDIHFSWLSQPLSLVMDIDPPRPRV